MLNRFLIEKRVFEKLFLYFMLLGFIFKSLQCNLQFAVIPRSSSSVWYNFDQWWTILICYQLSIVLVFVFIFQQSNILSERSLDLLIANLLFMFINTWKMIICRLIVFKAWKWLILLYFLKLFLIFKITKIKLQTIKLIIIYYLYINNIFIIFI